MQASDAKEHEMISSGEVNRSPRRADTTTVTVSIDPESFVSSGGEELAILLDMDALDIRDAPIGVLIHADDITLSPRVISGTTEGMIVRFKHRTDGYIRIQVQASPAPQTDCWDLRLSAIGADVVDLRSE